jgi:hypothetical protein
MAEETPKLRVLLHESEQVSSLIERAQGTVNTLFGLVLPAAGAFLLFAPEVTETSVPLPLLAVFFVAIVTLALVFNAGLWLEVTRYTRYKYLVLFPKLYEVAGLAGKESLGHFLAAEHLKQRDYLGLLFQAIALGASVGLSAWIVVSTTQDQATRLALLGSIALLAGCAAGASLYLGSQVRKTFEAIAAQRPASAETSKPEADSSR